MHSHMQMATQKKMRAAKPDIGLIIYRNYKHALLGKIKILHLKLFHFITCKSSHCFQHILAIAILSICPSVCLSCRWISQKRCKLGSPSLHHQTQDSMEDSMTLNNLERQNRGFYGFLVISGCDTSLYHSHGGATLLSLCDPDREFGICILT